MVASSVKKVVSEVVHGEFANTCSDFSVIEVTMSQDLRYADIFILFYDVDELANQEKILSELNYDFSGKFDSKFAKISLKKVIAEQMKKKMLFKYMPSIRFKVAEEGMIYVC